MKPRNIAIAACAFSLTTTAQVGLPGAAGASEGTNADAFGPGPSPAMGSNAEAGATNYAVTERGPNHKVWQRTRYEMNSQGKLTSRVESYTELATGMHFKRNGRGPWIESTDQIVLQPGNLSACATNGPYQVTLPSDIYDGVIDVTAPDGTTHLKTRPLGIALFDGTNSVLLASLTNSVGKIVVQN